MKGYDDPLHVCTGGAILYVQDEMRDLMSRIEILHPDYRPGRGEKRTDRWVELHDEAADAYRVWIRIWNNRLEGQDAYVGVSRDRLGEVMSAGDLRAALVLAAVADATTRRIPATNGADPTSYNAEWTRRRFASYEMATTLREWYSAGTAPAVSLVPAGYADDTCRHGRRFDADCPACEV